MTKWYLPLSAMLLMTACSGEAVSTLAAPGSLNAARSSSTTADPTATFYLANDASYNLRGDGVTTFLEGSTSAFAGSSRYQDSECGVGSKVFAAASESGDAIMNSAASPAHQCAAYPRKVNIIYARIGANGVTTPEGTVSVKTFMNVRQLEQAAYNGSPATYIPVGTGQYRKLNSGDDGVKCGSNGSISIAFVPVTNTGIVTGADQAWVFRNAADTWTVSTDADVVDPVSGVVTHHDKAYCAGNGALYHMPVHFSVRTNVGLTP